VFDFTPIVDCEDATDWNSNSSVCPHIINLVPKASIEGIDTMREEITNISHTGNLEFFRLLLYHFFFECIQQGCRS
jgi:hypothetical protein